MYTYKSENTPMTTFHTKNNYIYNHVKKHTHKPQKFSPTPQTYT